MPIHKTSGGQWQWGQHGAKYATRSGAERQAAAAHANGYRGDDGYEALAGKGFTTGREMTGRGDADHGVTGSNVCAGILFRAPGPTYLLLHRTDREEWEGPGGHIESGESPVDAARRETEEETGFVSAALPRFLDSRNGYTLFLHDVDAPFRPRLNHEHDEWRWWRELPDTTHPQLKRVISDLAPQHRSDSLQPLPNETQVIERLKNGELPSPVRFGPLWLFKMRVTGTGIAYRPQHKEWVYRPPKYWLTEELLRRVDGLPVLAGHAEKGPVSGKEYHGRAIGILVHPWIQGDDVWGIAKIYDDNDAALIVNKLPSTSPSVTFANDAGELVELANGEKLFIEGDPLYIDHLAAVPEGVWDKYEGPTGINLSALTGVTTDDCSRNATGAVAPYSWRP